jgi:hypothetical protein
MVLSMKWWFTGRDTKLAALLVAGVIAIFAGLWRILLAVFAPYAKDHKQKNTVFRKYLIVWLATGLMASLLLMRDLLVFVAMLTAGIGLFAAVAAVTLFAYLTCFLPTAYYWTSHRKRAFFASCLLAGAVAFGPMFYVRFQAESEAALLQKDDFAIRLAVLPRSVELRHNEYGAKDVRGFDTKLCPAFCRGLLMSGHVDWVRIVKIDDSQRDDPSVTMTFKKAAGNACRFSEVDGSSTETCFVPHVAAAAGLIVTMESKQQPYVRPNSGQKKSTFELVKHASATLADGKTAKSVLKGTTLVYKNWTPFSIFPLSTTNSIEAAGELPRPFSIFSQLGYDVSGFDAGTFQEPVVPYKPGRRRSRGSTSYKVSAEHTRQVLALLDSPQQEPFNRAQEHFIRDWCSAARDLSVQSKDVEMLLRRLVAEPRLTSSTDLHFVVFNRPEYVAATLPVVFDMLENWQPGVWRNAEWIAARLKEAELQPYADRISKLVSKHNHPQFPLNKFVRKVGQL